MAPKESESGFFITTKDVYDEVIGSRDDLKEVITLLKETRKDVDDHEKRIRFVEKCLYALPVTGLAAVFALVSDQFHLLGK